MKLETIKYIDELLLKRKSSLAASYENIKSNLAHKQNELAECERVMLEGAKQVYKIICAVYEDFLNHQWQCATKVVGCNKPATECATTKSVDI